MVTNYKQIKGNTTHQVRVVWIWMAGVQAHQAEHLLSFCYKSLYSSPGLVFHKNDFREAERDATEEVTKLKPHIYIQYQ